MIDKSESINELATALAKVQATIQDAHKDVDGYAERYKYANLGQVLALVRPILSAQGLSVSQHATDGDAEHVRLTTMLLHSSGQYLSSSIQMPSTPMKGNTAAQGFGSAITYARRYALTAIIGMTQTDDDGASVTHNAPEPIINAVQSAELANLIDETSTDIDKFCEYFKALTIDDLLAKDFPRALASLKKKLPQS